MTYTALIILNYNNSEDTINCIRSVEQYNTAPIKYIVVDNASPRATVIDEIDDYLATTFGEEYMKTTSLTPKKSVLPKCTFLVTPTNDGYAQGNNKGLRWAYCDDSIEYVMILNSDVLFVEDIITALIQDTIQLPQCGIVSPILYKKNLKGIDYNCARKAVSVSELIRCNFLHYVYKLCKKEINYNRYIIQTEKVTIGEDKLVIDLPSGSCMLLRKDLFQQIDSFDPRTFLYYEEDILYKKLQEKNKKNYLDTTLKCIHLGATTTKKNPSKLMQKASQQSAAIYVKHYCHCNPLLLAIYKFSVWFYSVTYSLQQNFGIRMSR